MKSENGCSIGQSSVSALATPCSRLTKWGETAPHSTSWFNFIEKFKTYPTARGRIEMIESVARRCMRQIEMFLCSRKGLGRRINPVSGSFFTSRFQLWCQYDGLIGCFPLKCGTTSYQRAFGARHRNMEVSYLTHVVYNMTSMAKFLSKPVAPNIVPSEYESSPRIYGLMNRLSLHPRYFSSNYKDKFKMKH